jgi:hypothetical protein
MVAHLFDMCEHIYVVHYNRGAIHDTVIYGFAFACYGHILSSLNGACLLFLFKPHIVLVLLPAGMQVLLML